jgi:hypothetical protein
MHRLLIPVVLLLAVVAASSFFTVVGATAASYNNRHPYVFYEGNNCTQKRLFSVGGHSGSYNCTNNSSRCSGRNDAARSLLIKFNYVDFSGSGNTRHRVVLFDDPAGSTFRDYATIDIVNRRGRTTFCVPSFDILKVYDWGNIRFHRRDDGKLSGKVSRIKVIYRP